jgi:multiple sugar transport system permease protein/raffinose/stachyose/melibiose transport system permease protein
MRPPVYYKIKRIATNSLIHLFLILVSLTCLFPLFWMISSSLKTQATVFKDMSLIPREFHFENYLYAWQEGGFGRYFLNSILYTLLVVAGIVLVSSLAGYGFSRLKFPGRNVLFFIFLAAMLIPLPASFVVLYVLLKKLHLLNTRLGYVLSMINAGLAMAIFLLKNFFDKLPRELEDAARIDGCSKLGIWRHVALPFARPALAVVAVFSALNIWNEYMLALIIFDSKDLMPLQRALLVFQGEFLTNYPLLMAGLTITALPIIIVYLFMQKYIVRGVTSEAVFG